MVKYDFSGKTAIVTGASRGIGKAIADKLLELNCEVVITSTGESPDWNKKYQKCLHRQVDFLSQRSVDAFLEEIDSMGNIDVLVNNAGIHIPQAIYDLDDQCWDKILRVNLYGPMQLMRKISKKMKAIKRGKIVNISSIAGLVSKPGSNAYSASKAGLIGLTRASALDLAPYGVLVNALCPGPTQTDLVERVLSQEQRKEIESAIPLKRFAKPEEIANVAVFLCSDLNTYLTGATIVVDGGLTIKGK